MDKPITFLYNGKCYTTANLEGKLEKLGITLNDIVIPNRDCSKGEINTDIVKYYFYNDITKETIVSVYDILDHLNKDVNTNNFRRITTEEYNNLINKI